MEQPAFCTDEHLFPEPHMRPPLDHLRAAECFVIASQDRLRWAAASETRTKQTMLLQVCLAHVSELLDSLGTTLEHFDLEN